MTRSAWISTFIAVVAAILISHQRAYTAPIQNYPVTVEQPDGTTLRLFVSGDEFYNWWHDDAGYVIMRHPSNGCLVYAEKRGGRLVASENIVGIVSPGDLGIQPHLMPDEAYLKEMHLEISSNLFPQSHPPRDISTTASAMINLTAFVRFADQEEYSQSFETFDSLFNLTGDSVVSLREYYRSMSYDLSFDIETVYYPVPDGSLIVSYQDEHPRSYYMVYDEVTNPDGYRNSDGRYNREFALIENVLTAVEAVLPLGTVLDADDNGTVDNFTMIVQGDPEGWGSLLWPHHIWLWFLDFDVNGDAVRHFNLVTSNILFSRGIGVVCHEVGHSLGLADYYHYNFDGFSPVGIWDVMSSVADPPQRLSAYSVSAYKSWLNHPTIDIPEREVYTLADLSHGRNSALQINSPMRENEYFFVEYRNNTVGQFDVSLPNSGLVVYRVNKDYRHVGNASGPPDELYVFRPGGTLLSDGDPDSAPLGPATGRTELNRHSDPAPLFFNGEFGGIGIRDVTIVGDSIQFTLYTPEHAPSQFQVVLTDDVSGTVSLNWSAPDDYSVSYYRVYRNNSLLAGTTSLTMTDELPEYGMYSYHVTGVTEDDFETDATEPEDIEWVEPGVVVLLWEPDENPGSGDSLACVLQKIGYGIRRVDNLYAAVLSAYPVMFCCLGMRSDGEHYIHTGSEEESILIDYLDNGGILYMEGGDAFGWNPPSNLLPYFNLYSIDDGEDDLVTVKGVTGTFASGMLFDYAGVNDDVDQFWGKNGAIAFLYNPADVQACGVFNDAGDYKTVAVGFELGMLVDDESPSTKYDLLSGLMEWMDIPNPHWVSVDGEIFELPREFAVLAPYPNPFNGVSTVPIRMNRSGRVEVAVFDILGRRVMSTGYQMLSGEHRIQVAMPPQLSSGVYFLKVGFDDQISTRSLVLVK